MSGAGLDRDADEGSREIDAACRDHASLADEIVEPLPRQYDDIGRLAAAQSIQQSQRRREIGIDACTARSLISSGKAAHRSHQGKRREHAHDVFHLSSLTAALSVMPTGQAASSSPSRRR
jgi:hypothetical protein